MKPLTLQQIRQATGGKPLTAIPADAPAIHAVCTDSRRIERESIYVALRGERFDGHEFLAEARKRGAIAAVIEREPAERPEGMHLLQVPDTYTALGRIARLVRKSMVCRVVAVAGSNGKTGTKLLIDAALNLRLRGSVSPKSFNNNVGVPMTMFAADPVQDYLVLEMGTNHHGEILPLTEMAQPDVAVITNCGAEHLEGLDDLMGVRRENAMIVEGLNPKGLLIVNGDDKDLLAAVSTWRGAKLTFGFDESNDLYAADVRCDETGVRFQLNGRSEVHVPLLGRHTACNALAAIAVARRLAVPEEIIFHGLSHAHGPDMRLQLQRCVDVTLLNDAYNANPNSMRAAIDTAASLSLGARRIAVLGDMRELGQTSDRYHREIGELAAVAGKLDLLACVGPNASTIMADAAVSAGLSPAHVLRFPDADSAARDIPELLHEGDLVLLKASRGIHLETVATAVRETRERLHQKAAV